METIASVLIAALLLFQVRTPTVGIAVICAVVAVVSANLVVRLVQGPLEDLLPKGIRQGVLIVLLLVLAEVAYYLLRPTLGAWLAPAGT